MFGLVVAGRPVQIDPLQVDTNRFLFQIGNPEEMNHVVLFLLGTIPLPPHLGALVYFQYQKNPSLQPPPEWKLLGYICNEKPSCIFKISGLKPAPAETSQPLALPFFPSTDPSAFFPQQSCAPAQDQNSPSFAQIGILIEPLEKVKIEISSLTFQNSETLSAASSNNLQNFAFFSQKLIENFYNYVSSFSTLINLSNDSSQESYIPTSSLNKWRENLARKLQANPNFLKDL